MALPAPHRPPRWWRLTAEDRWLLNLCASRLGFVMIVNAYAASQPLLMKEWNMTAAQAGMIHSAWAAGYTISLSTVGFLADRYGPKRISLLFSLFAGLTALGFALFARDFTSAIVLYGLTALFSGGSYTPVLAVIAQEIAPARRGRAVGFYIAASAAGSTMSFFVSSVMLALTDWRGAFLATALGPAAGSVLAFLALRDTPNEVPLPPAGKEEGKEDVGMVRAVLKNKPAMLNIWSYSWHNWELLGMRAWIATFLAAVIGGGVSGSAAAAAKGAAFTSAMYAVAMAGNVVGGSLSDRWGRNTVILLMGATSAACAFAIGWLFAAPLWLVVLVGVVFSFAAIGDSPVLSAQLSELVPQRHLGGAYSVRSMVGYPPGIVSPWLFGLAIDWGRAVSGTMGALAWGLAFCVLGVGAVLAPLGALWQRRLLAGAESPARPRGATEAPR